MARPRGVHQYSIEVTEPAARGPWSGSRVGARIGHRGGPGWTMAVKRAASGDTKKWKPRSTGAGAPPSAVAQALDRERRLVDIDPWAVLLEQLMEVPDEDTPAKRERGEGG